MKMILRIRQLVVPQFQRAKVSLVLLIFSLLLACNLWIMFANLLHYWTRDWNQRIIEHVQELNQMFFFVMDCISSSFYLHDHKLSLFPSSLFLSFLPHLIFFLFSSLSSFLFLLPLSFFPSSPFCFFLPLLLLFPFSLSLSSLILTLSPHFHVCFTYIPQ